MSIRQAAREFGLSRKTIRKMMQFSLPPGYARKKPVVRPKLGPWLGIIDQILVDDQTQPKKQRHLAAVQSLPPTCGSEQTGQAAFAAPYGGDAVVVQWLSGRAHQGDSGT